MQLSYFLYPEALGVNDFWVTIEGVGDRETKGRFQLQVWGVF
jgi:hypothetical protein